jgi:hypothetical protein
MYSSVQKHRRIISFNRPEKRRKGFLCHIHRRVYQPRHTWSAGNSTVVGVCAGKHRQRRGEKLVSYSSSFVLCRRLTVSRNPRVQAIPRKRKATADQTKSKRAKGGSPLSCFYPDLMSSKAILGVRVSHIPFQIPPLICLSLS